MDTALKYVISRSWILSIILTRIWLKHLQPLCKYRSQRFFDDVPKLIQEKVALASSKYSYPREGCLADSKYSLNGAKKKV